MKKTLRNRLTLLGTTSLFTVALVAAPLQFSSVLPDLAVAQAAGAGSGGTDNGGGSGGHDGDGGGGGRVGDGGAGGSETGDGGGGGTDTDSSGGKSGRS